MLRSNGRDFYDIANVFYDELPREKELTIISGDVGAIKGTPYLTYFKKIKPIFYLQVLVMEKIILQ